MNHYHLLVQALSDALSGAMQRFGISYTKAMNRRFARVGSVFRGEFQAARVDRDEYLLHLSRYLHLNPVRHRLAKCPEDWRFSSYPEYVGLRHGTLPQAEVVLRFFVAETRKTSEVSKTSEVCDEARQRYRDFVEAYQAADRTGGGSYSTTDGNRASRRVQTSEVCKTSEV